MSGLGDKEVADKMGLSTETVRTYWKRIRNKMGGASRAQVIAGLARRDAEAELRSVEGVNRGLVDEIIARKQAEASLRESEKRYRSLFEQSLDAVFLWTSEGNGVDLNPAAEKLLGYQKVDFVGRSGFDFIPASHLQRAHDAREKILGGGTYEGEMPFIHRDGHVVQMNWRSRGEVFGGHVLGVGRITSRLRESQVSTALAIVDSAGNFQAVNEAFGRVWNVEPAELEGKPVSDVLDADSASAIMNGEPASQIELNLSEGRKALLRVDEIMGSIGLLKVLSLGLI